MALQSLPSFQALSSLPAPKQPVAEDLDPRPLLPAVTPRGEFLPVSPVSSDRDREDRRRWAYVDSEGLGVSVERRSFFSESSPDAIMKPPNRLLHDRHAAKMEKMLQEISTFSGRVKLRQEIVWRRMPACERFANSGSIPSVLTKDPEGLEAPAVMAGPIPKEKAQPLAPQASYYRSDLAVEFAGQASAAAEEQLETLTCFEQRYTCRWFPDMLSQKSLSLCEVSNACEEKGPRKSPGTTNVSMTHVMKFLAGDALASAIIGKGGAVITQIRTNCNAKLALTDKGQVFPSTDCRVLTAQANSEEELNEVARQIIEKLSELVKTSGASEACGSDGELKLRTLVPKAAVGGIIGKGGAAIKQMRETSGAKISIGEAVGAGPGAEQMVTVSGPEEALQTVIAEVNRQIQLLSSEAWYSTWAASTGCITQAMAGLASSLQLQPSLLGLGGQALANPGIATMMQVAQSMPPYVMEDSRGFALSCVVPNRLVGGLIGRGGSGTKEVQMLTGTKIGIREIPDDPDNRSLNIATRLMFRDIQLPFPACVWMFRLKGLFVPS
ncbi:BTR1 [Symbiodinium sp. CCMP2456]|nr:BTR1 [Symbiodinium sp. CCMP2456]